MNIPEVVQVLEAAAAAAGRFPGYEDWPPRFRALAARVLAGMIPVSAYQRPDRGSELTWALGFYDEQARVAAGIQTQAQAAARIKGLGAWKAKEQREKDIKQGLLAGGGILAGALGAVALWWGLDRRKKAQEEPNSTPQPEQPSTGPGPGPVQPGPAAVVWTGPINLKQVEGASIAGVPSFVQSCTGDGNPSCGQIADAWKDAEGRRLPAMRRALKLPDGPLVLAGFSAGGHLIRRVLEDPRDRAEILAVYLADATYTTAWRDKAKGLAAPIEAVATYAREAGPAGHLLLATASSAPNKNYPNGAQVLIATALEAGASVVRQRAIEGQALEPQPERMFAMPGAIFLDFGGKYSHERHATTLSRQVWERYLRPFIERRGGAT